MLYGIELKKLREGEKWLRFTPHDLRRTFGNETSRAGAPNRVVMTAGGWKSESAFRRYTLGLRPNDIAAYSPVMAAMGILPDENGG